jgi:hypothetical protein
MQRVRLAVQVLLVTVFLSAAYELKAAATWDTPIRVVVLITLTYALTGIAAGVMTAWMGRTRWVRAIAMGSSWIEGYWYLSTYRGDNEKRVSSVIALIEYQGPELDLKVTSFKPRSPESAIATASTSVSAFLNAQSLKYISYFEYQVNTTTIQGLALGTFYKDGQVRHPTQYHGTLRYFNQLEDERQIGRKLSRSEVASCIRTNPANWVNQILAEQDRK